MRLVLAAAILGLAGCSVQNGMNLNYPVGTATPYGKYKQAREVALINNTRPPSVIPVVLPVNAPTPEQISGAVRTRATTTVTAVRPPVPVNQQNLPKSYREPPL